jgi:hypothetical protein
MSPLFALTQNPLPASPCLRVPSPAAGSDSGTFGYMSNTLRSVRRTVVCFCAVFLPFSLRTLCCRQAVRLKTCPRRSGITMNRRSRNHQDQTWDPSMPIHFRRDPRGQNALRPQIHNADAAAAIPLMPARSPLTRALFNLRHHITFWSILLSFLLLYFAYWPPR